MSVAAKDIREQFLRFFESKGHRVVPSANLIPESDPTLMFVNAGMVPFKRTFLGEEVREYNRAASSQKCMRVSGKHNDLENVGRTPRHHTFFEMLGNFSFGDYFKREAIDFAWELLTERFGIASERLVASVFREDDDAFELWQTAVGLPAEKIFRLDEDENFWAMGDTGPCGPCAEIHVDFGDTGSCTSDVCDPSCDCGRWLEIWNLVFMQYNREPSGEMIPLPKPSIDTGGGLERWAQILQGVPSNYDTDLFTPLVSRAADISGVSPGDDEEKDVSLRVVADHVRATTFLVGDGVLPSNAGRGYVLRRILRRASRHGVLLGVEEPFLFQVADAVIDEMAGAFPELGERRDYITTRIRRDEERFLETLSKGLALLEEEIREAKARSQRVLPGASAFRLYDTYGFPVDLTADILRGHDMEIDQAAFDDSMEQQRSRARAAWRGSGDAAVSEVYQRIAADVTTDFCGYLSLEAESDIAALLVDGRPADLARTGDAVEVIVEETPLYAESGGQVGDRGQLSTPTGGVEIEETHKPVEGLAVHRGRVTTGEIRLGQRADLLVDAELRQATVRNHSGTHLLHAALRQVLGPQAMQKGSLVGPDRLRFDFTHDAPLTGEEIERIEDLANQWIQANLPCDTRVMDYQEAVATGAMAIFEEKYGDEVRVVSFGPRSTELCGGTHARSSGEIGLLKIFSESGIAAGVRRIEALTGPGALQHIRRQEQLLQRTADLLRTPVVDLPARVEKLLEERRVEKREIEELKAVRRGAAAGNQVAAAREVDGLKMLALRVDGTGAVEMRSLADDLRARLGSGVVMLVAETEGKVLIAVGVTKDAVKTHKAGDLIREVAKVVGGGGGGRADFAQAGGKDASKIDAAVEKFYQLVEAG